MIKFTKEEVGLCKQVAEKYRKDLKIGMYVWRKFCKTIQLIYKLDKEDKEIYTVILKGNKLNHLYWNNLKGGWLIPLWTISDCLEFLRERDWCLYKLIEWVGGEKFQCSIINSSKNLGGRNCFDRLGKTALEACLKAVLAVIKEEK